MFTGSIFRSGGMQIEIPVYVNTGGGDLVLSVSGDARFIVTSYDGYYACCELTQTYPHRQQHPNLRIEQQHLRRLQQDYDTLTRWFVDGGFGNYHTTLEDAIRDNVYKNHRSLIKISKCSHDNYGSVVEEQDIIDYNLGMINYSDIFGMSVGYDFCKSMYEKKWYGYALENKEILLFENRNEYVKWKLGANPDWRSIIHPNPLPEHLNTSEKTLENI